MSAKIYPDLAVAILAGGASRRFGSDKALFRFGSGHPTLIERTVAIARSLSDRVVIIGHDRFAGLNLEAAIVPDDEPGRGPLAGILTGLRVLERSRVLVLACDMPCLSPALLRMLIERPVDRDRIVVPRTDDGRWHPMHAIYPRSMLGAIAQALETGNGSVRSLFGLVEIDAVSESELRRIDPGLDSLVNLNDPSGIPRARRCME